MSEFNEEIIVRYFDNSLSTEEEEILFEWLKSSEENRSIFLQYKKMYAVGKIRYYSSPLVLENALNTFTRRTETMQKQKTRKVRIQMLKYAAMLMLLFSVSYLTWRIAIPPEIKYNTVIVDQGDDVKELTLPDGSRVWLNNGSTFTYPENFSTSARTVTLSGEAYFKVKTDSTRPFIVKTSSMQVKVFGTSFNVNTINNDNTIKTTLESGRVTINDRKGKLLTNMLPGQMASYNVTGGKVEILNVNTDLYTLWRKGLIVLDKASLNDIAEKIESIYNVNITINSQQKLPNKINFVFRKTQNLDTVMRMLEYVVPIKHKKYDNQIFINYK